MVFLLWALLCFDLYSFVDFAAFSCGLCFASSSSCLPCGRVWWDLFYKKIHTDILTSRNFVLFIALCPHVVSYSIWLSVVPHLWRKARAPRSAPRRLSLAAPPYLGLRRTSASAAPPHRPPQHRCSRAPLCCSGPAAASDEPLFAAKSFRLSSSASHPTCILHCWSPKNICVRRVLSRISWFDCNFP